MEGEEKKQYKKGLWTAEEDRVLLEHIKVHGIGQWNRIPKLTGLQRCGKSCRLRWLNYLSPNVKRGCFSEEEEDLIIRLHKLLGNRWSLIAGRVPGRTDNQVKNHWNTHLSKKLGLKMQSKNLIHSSSLKHLQKTVPINSINVGYYKDDQPPNYNISGVAKSMEFEVIQDQNKPNLDNVTEEDDHDLQGCFSERPRESPCTRNSGPEFPSPICSSDLSDFVSSNQGFWEFIDGYPDYLDHQMWQSF